MPWKYFSNLFWSFICASNNVYKRSSTIFGIPYLQPKTLFLNSYENIVLKCLCRSAKYDMTSWFYLIANCYVCSKWLSCCFLSNLSIYWAVLMSSPIFWMIFFRPWSSNELLCSRSMMMPTNFFSWIGVSFWEARILLAVAIESSTLA